MNPDYMATMMTDLRPTSQSSIKATHLCLNLRPTKSFSKPSDLPWPANGKELHFRLAEIGLLLELTPKLAAAAMLAWRPSFLTQTSVYADTFLPHPSISTALASTHCLASSGLAAGVSYPAGLPPPHRTNCSNTTNQTTRRHHPIPPTTQPYRSHHPIVVNTTVLIHHSHGLLESCTGLYPHTRSDPRNKAGAPNIRETRLAMACGWHSK